MEMTGLNTLSQQSSRLFSIDTNKANPIRKTLGAKRSLPNSQRSVGLSKPTSLRIVYLKLLYIGATLSLSESDIPKSGEITRNQSVVDQKNTVSKVEEKKEEKKEEVLLESTMEEEKEEVEEEKIEKKEEKEKEEKEEEKKEKEMEKEKEKEEEEMEEEEVDEEKEKEKEEEKKEKKIKSKQSKQTKSKEGNKKSEHSSKETKNPSQTPTKPKKEKTSHKEITPKKTKNPSRLLIGSMLSEIDRDILSQLIMYLPDARLLKRKSASQASAVITGRSARSVKVMCAVARGCPVIKQQWLYDCLEKSEWLPYEAYIDPIAKEGLMNRHMSKHGIFYNSGYFYIQKGTSPSYDELKEIILAADGKVTRHLEEATICIGNEKEDELKIPCVSVQFVIEGVMNGKPPKVEDYCINDKTVLVEKDHSDSEEYSIVCFIDNKQDRFKN